MSDWKKYKLGELLELVIDHRGKTPKKLGFDDFHSNGYPVLSAKHVKTSGLINLDVMRFAKQEMYEKWMKIPTKKGDIVLTSEAPLGELFYIDGSTQYLLGQRVFGLRPNTTLVNPMYLFAWLSSSKGQSALQARATGSTVQGIKQSELLNIELSIPNLIEQVKVADNLFSLNNKIQLNTQINQTLEQIAQAIFKSWFVDFEPTRAKATALAAGKTQAEAELSAMQVISGKTAEELTTLAQTNPQQYTQLTEIAKAFPSELVETEMGEIPLGWERTSITDKRICEIIKPKIHIFEGEKNYIATANISKNSIVGTLEKITYENRPSRANMQPTINSIWFAKMVGEHKAILIDKDDKLLLENTILSTGFLGLKPQENTKSFLYCFINSDYFILSKNQLATGAVQIALNNSSFAKIEVILPKKEILKVFEETVSSLYSKISQNQRENKALSETRDLLLSKLLSGEIHL
ncbi:restriction endonuclease subunit S [Pelistega ratti]|uniref:restriction endonuclease subunit S n=1 Tax=Pelistega ratti TaxID=2652177 RepID=UPI0013598C03|nr:restriction endonuclease subunit S [Pelistega ratti]